MYQSSLKEKKMEKFKEVKGVRGVKGVRVEQNWFAKNS